MSCAHLFTYTVAIDRPFRLPYKDIGMICAEFGPTCIVFVQYMRMLPAKDQHDSDLFFLFCSTYIYSVLLVVLCLPLFN